MKRRVHFLFLFLFSLPAFLTAQSLQKREAIPMQPIPGPGTSINSNDNAPVSAQERATQVEIGLTQYDVESYGSTGHRFYEGVDGKLYAAWHFSDETDSFTDRGTAVSTLEEPDWTEQERVEGAERGGFPSYAVNEAGDEFVSSHVNDGIWNLGFHSKLANEDSWTTGIIPTNTPAGMVWGKIAIGGDNGEVIHAIGITLRTDFGGIDYEGMIQHPLYYRSSDKGMTWEVQDMILPGIDSNNYLDIEAESYTIEARGNTVAIAILPTFSFGDAVLLKSTDGGDNWENTSLLDTPLDNYDFLDFYTYEDVNTDLSDPDLPDSLAILSTDGHGSLVIDNNDMVHLSVGRMYYTVGDGLTRSFYPTMDGLFYWNESMGANNMNIVARLEDFDMDDSIDYVENSFVSVYQRSATGMPSMGIDDDGQIFITYSAVHELYIDEEDEQNFRQVYIIKSSDNGQTFTEPFAVINGETFDDLFVPQVEGVFPQIPSNIGETIHLIYDQDFRPGLAVWGDEDPTGGTSIVYVELEKDDFRAVVISSNLNTNNDLQAKVSPSLTTGNVFLEYFPTESTTVEYEVINALGAQVIKGNKLEAASGYLREEIKMTDLAQGLYYIRMTAENAQKTFKVVKQ